MNEPAREYFWGATLDKANPTYTWTFDEEEEDSDYLIHTLFLKQAVLGASAIKDERNLVQVETKDFNQKDLKHPLFSLTLGRNDMTSLDVSFGHEVPVVFRLVEGSGPVSLSAQQLVEFPDDKNTSQDESELECTEDESEIEEEEEETVKKGGPGKRKASTQKTGKSKDDDEEMDDDDEEDDEDMDDDDEEDEEDVESSPEKGDKKKGKKGKDVKKKPVKGAKVSPKKETKKPKKSGKAK